MSVNLSVENMYLCTVAAVSAFMDFKSGKVRNYWILFCLMTDFWYLLFVRGAGGIPGFAAGVCLPVLLLFPLFYLRMLSAGDIKVFCVLGGVMGAGRLLPCMMVSFAAGAVLSLVLMLKNHCLVQRFRYLGEYLGKCRREGKLLPYRNPGQGHWKKGEQIHFTVPILVSILLYTGGIF